MIPRYRHLLKSARCNRVFDGKQGRYVDIIRSHFSGKNDDTMMENAIDCKTDKTVIMKAEDKMKMQAKPHVSKVQTQLKYEQTKLDLSKLNINQSDEVKDNKYAKPSEDIKPKQDAEDYKPIKSLATVVVSDVPAVVTLPDIRRVADTDGVTKIVIDLETSSRAEDTEICQIAATDGSDEFNVYIYPRGYITSGASAVNNLRKKRGGLYHGKKRVNAVYLNQGLSRFLEWLKLKMPCLFIAHNAKLFDAKHLIKAIASCNVMHEFSQKVLGFSDSLTAFRERFPERKTYSQTSLAKDLLGATYNAHDALEDVRMLHRLVSKYIPNELLVEHSFTVSWHRDYLDYSQMTQDNMKTLKPLLRARKVSEGMATKIAGSGLNLSHLEFAHKSGGKDKLYDVLTASHAGKPRVTNNKKVLEDICSFFEDNMPKTKNIDTYSTERKCENDQSL